MKREELEQIVTESIVMAIADMIQQTGIIKDMADRIELAMPKEPEKKQVVMKTVEWGDALIGQTSNYPSVKDGKEYNVIYVIRTSIPGEPVTHAAFGFPKFDKGLYEDIVSWLEDLTSTKAMRTYSSKVYSTINAETRFTNAQVLVTSVGKCVGVIAEMRNTNHIKVVTAEFFMKLLMGEVKEDASQETKGTDGAEATKGEETKVTEDAPVHVPNDGGAKKRTRSKERVPVQAVESGGSKASKPGVRRARKS